VSERFRGTSPYERIEHDDDRAAKRVILAGELTAGTDFDYIDGQQTSATVDTYVYKLGGSGGTTVRTVTVTYTSSAKTDIDSVVYS
jgi:hypothetical protein